MAKIRVAVLGTVGKSVALDPDATKGATIGTNLFMADGSVATQSSLLTYLGLGSTAQSATQNHRLLAGLALGDDHPQYTRKDTLTARGDLYRRGASTVERVALGTTNQILSSNGTDAVWQTRDANPTASLGLAAVNGSAATFMRSDAAPALDQAIAPTWTATHIFSKVYGAANTQALQLSSALPGLLFKETDAAADSQKWVSYANLSIFRFAALNDAETVETVIFAADRSGNLGINTTAPNLTATGRALTILGSTTARGLLELGSTSVTTAVFGQIGGYNGTSVNATVLQFVGDGTNSDTGEMKFFTKATGAAISEKMRITGAGTVRIGTNQSEAFIGAGHLGVARDGFCEFSIRNCTADTEGFFGAYTSEIAMGSYSNSPVSFYVNNSLRAQINTSTQFLVSDGTVSLPVYTFINDPDTGFYRAGGNDFYAVANGVAAARFLYSATTAVQFGDGSVSQPSLGFISDPDTGFYRANANILVAAAGGTAMFAWTSTFVAVQGGFPLHISDGAAATPSLTFDNDRDTGFFRQAANTMGISAGGGAIGYLDAGGGGGRIQEGDGAVGTPAYTHYNDTDSGWYRRGADNIAAAVGATRVLDVVLLGANNGRIGVFGGDQTNSTSAVIVNDTQNAINLFALRGDGQARFADGSAGTPSISALNDTDTGWSFPGSNTLRLSLGGSQAFQFNGVTTTGAQTATFTATNKPGSGTAGPIAWLPVLTAGGTQGYIPIFGA